MESLADRIGAREIVLVLGSMCVIYRIRCNTLNTTTTTTTTTDSQSISKIEIQLMPFYFRSDGEPSRFRRLASLDCEDAALRLFISTEAVVMLLPTARVIKPRATSTTCEYPPQKNLLHRYE